LLISVCALLQGHVDLDSSQKQRLFQILSQEPQDDTEDVSVSCVDANISVLSAVKAWVFCHIVCIKKCNRSKYIPTHYLGQ